MESFTANGASLLREASFHAILVFLACMPFVLIYSFLGKQLAAVEARRVFPSSGHIFLYNDRKKILLCVTLQRGS